MSVVIIGGNERMACVYKEICMNHGCTAKVYTKERGSLKIKVGCPDLLIILMSTVSHQMVISAMAGAKRNNVDIARIQSSSATALNKFFEEYRENV
jgi:hypothetical protein